MEQGDFLFVTKKSHPESKTVYLTAIYKNVFMYLPKPGKEEGKNVKKISGGLQLSSGGLKSLTAPLGAS